jgi:hypothetical protein
VNSGFQVSGMCEAVDALRKAGVPGSLLGSRRATDLYNLGHTIGQRGGRVLSKRSPPGRRPRVLRVSAE